MGVTFSFFWSYILKHTIPLLKGAWYDMDIVIVIGHIIIDLRTMDFRPEVKGEEVAISRSVNGACHHNCPVCTERQKKAVIYCTLTMKNSMRKSVWSHNWYEPHGHK